MILSKLSRGRSLATSCCYRKASPVAAIYPEDVTCSPSTVRPFEEIPGPKPLPIIGNIWRYMPPFGTFDITRMHRNAMRMRKEFGPIVREKVVADRTVVHVFDPHDIETVFRNEGKYPCRMSHRALLKYRQQRPEVYRNGGVIPTNGEEWAEVRQKFQVPLMKKVHMEVYRDDMFDIADEVVDKCRALGEAGTENFTKILYFWALEATGLIALDARLNCLQTYEDPNSRQRILFEAASTTHNVVMRTENGLPFWRLWETPTYKKLVRAQDTMVRIINEYLAENKQQPNTGESSTILQQFLSQPGDKRDIYTMITDIFMAGIDTTSYAMTYLLYHLGTNMRCQDLVRQELRDLVAENPRPTLKDLDSLPYLRACVRESHRLIPVALGTGRILDNDVTLSGYNIPAGVMIVLHNQIASRDPEQFYDCDKFIPERWVRNNGSAPENHPFSFLPFGYGIRMCIGRRIAENAINVLITRMLLTHSFEYTHDQPMDCVTNLINAPDQPLKLAFKKC